MKISRAQLAARARDLRRAGKPEMALRLLSPRLQAGSTKRGESNLLEEEAEYAACLINVGAISEGISRLSGLNGKRHPRIWMLRTFAHVRQWDWEGALPSLHELLEHPGLGAAERASASVYLATALMHGSGDLRGSRRLLEHAIASPRCPERARLTALLLLGQNHVLAGRPRLALPLLRGETASPLHAVMARQWLCLLRLRGGAKAARARALHELRHEVRPAFEAMGAWEWARSCEVFPAEMLGDREALERLYFGTPYLAFKRRMVRVLGGRTPERASWRLGEGGKREAWIDLASGATSAGLDLKPGQLPHRVLERLASDHFRPVSIAELHEAVYPGEPFRPFHSPSRVHQGIKRLRAGLDAAAIPLGVEEKKERYRLAPRPGARCVLQLGSSPAPDARLLRAMEKLSASLDPQGFRCEEAARVLGRPRRSTQRLLAGAERAGWLELRGAGPGATWRFGECVFKTENNPFHNLKN